MPSSKCPKCGAVVGSYRNPFPTVDIIIPVRFNADGWGIVVIKRKNPPHGWAIPGGFIDYGESAEAAALREMKEETNLVTNPQYLKLFGVYSDPNRDLRAHTMSIVYETLYEDECLIRDTMKAQDDAAEIEIVPIEELLRGEKYPLAFDHKQILRDWSEKTDGGNLLLCLGVRGWKTERTS
jgi:8-oxo-dGTP diphosphatase